MLARAAIEKTVNMTQGNMLARYSVLHELGRGAIGTVYAARDRTTGAVVALKRLDPALLNESDPNLADRVVKQARSARDLRHRNIVRVDDAGEAGGTVYVAMEMLEGESLRKILDDGPLPITRAIQIIHDIACGLAYAHLEARVHGRLKPSNIMVLRSGVAKITDFGLGQLGQAALLSGARAGSLSYMSPEQARGEALDHRCDIFSLGALFYEMLAHRPPFEGDSPKEITKNILDAKPRPPSELNEHAPRALDAIVLSMLAKERRDRMPGAPVLLRELQRLEEGLGLGSGASAASDEPAASPPPARAEPELRTPDPDGLRDRAPVQDGPRVMRHREARAANGLGSRPDRSDAEVSQHRDQVIDREVFDYHRAMMQRESGRERSRPAMYAALALVLALLGVGLTDFMGLTSFMDYLPGRSEPSIAASPVQQAPATVPVTSPPIAPPPVAEATQEPLAAPPASPPLVPAEGQAQLESPGTLSATDPVPPKQLPTEPAPVAKAESMVVRAPEQPASASAAPPQELPRAMQSTAAGSEQQQGTARVIVEVSPRGEIYIDGKHHGTTPPITTVELKPGMHRIEVRRESRTPYLTYMTVQAGEVRRIRHDFDAKPMRPPAH
jgi:serine/threonine protein kinase